MREKLDVYEILNGKQDVDRLDILSIMNEKETNQEQHHAPDFDLYPAASEQEEKLAPDIYETPDAGEDEPSHRRSILWIVVKAAVLITAVVLFAAFVLSTAKVDTDSMAPLISKGDRVFVDKIVKDYSKGDIILYKDPHEQKRIARIIADEGDQINIKKAGGLYINNKLEEQDYVIGETFITDDNIKYPFLISENEVFVLGDNREDSVDSRNYQIGTVESDQIVGRVIYCIKKIR